MAATRQGQDPRRVEAGTAATAPGAGMATSGADAGPSATAAAATGEGNTAPTDGRASKQSPSITDTERARGRVAYAP